MKWIIRLIVPLALLTGIAWFVLAWQVVRTGDGYLFVKKEELSFREFVIDTREWGLTDYLKERKISKAIARAEWDKYKEEARKKWAAFSKKFEDMLEDEDIDTSSEKIKKNLEALRKKAQERYDGFVEDWEEGEISLSQFRKKIEKLEKQIEKELDKIKEKTE